MSSFDFMDRLPALEEINRVSAEAEQVRSHLAELALVQDVIDTPAWTAADMLVTEGVRTRTQTLAMELGRHQLFARHRYAFVSGFEDSAFFQCVCEARTHALICLTLHHHPENLPGLGVVANSSMRRIFGRVPGGNNQVEIAFHLVTLLYATFMIPVPARDTTPTPLWALITRDSAVHLGAAGDTPQMLTMQCLDLTPNADGVHNDPHGL